MAKETIVIGTYEDFGVWVRNSRLAKGYTQRQFAEKLGCAIEHLSKIENGHRTPSRLLTQDIIEALGYDYILAVREK